MNFFYCLLQQMSRFEDNFFFVIYPKTIILKGIYYDSKLPHYSISIFRGNLREDLTTVVPIRKQQLYQTLFTLEKGKLQFTQIANLHQCQQRRIVINQKDTQMGDFILRIDQYISNYQDYNSKYYEQKVKLNNNLQFQFEIYMANTRSQLSDLLIQYRGESDIRTPITIQSCLEQQKSYSVIRQLRQVQSQIYSPTLSVPRSQTRDQIDQEESVNSQVHLSTPREPKKGFKISLHVIPSQPVYSSQSINTHQQRNFLMQQFRQFLSLPFKEKLVFSAFTLLSLGTIYASMLPIKKI